MAKKLYKLKKQKNTQLPLINIRIILLFCLTAQTHSHSPAHRQEEAHNTFLQIHTRTHILPLHPSVWKTVPSVLMFSHFLPFQASVRRNKWLLNIATRVMKQSLTLHDKTERRCTCNIWRVSHTFMHNSSLTVRYTWAVQGVVDSLFLPS